MTTPAQSALYEVLHMATWGDKPLYIFNPNDKPVEELPVVIGFCNGGQLGWMEAVSIAQDGTVLGGHICSSEAYMPHDLGLVENANPTRQEEYRKHYPDGFRCEFVPHAKAKDHVGLHAAMQLYILKQTPTEQLPQQ